MVFCFESCLGFGWCDALLGRGGNLPAGSKGGFMMGLGFRVSGLGFRQALAGLVSRGGLGNLGIHTLIEQP